MEKINNIGISNFKSIREIDIKACRRVNILIGYPNVGKSNILEAISLLAYMGAGEPKISKLCRVQNFIELFHDGNIKENIRVTPTADDTINLNFLDNGSIDIKYIISEPSEEDHLTDSKSIVKHFVDDGKHIENKKDVFSATANFTPIKKYHYKSELSKNEVGYHSLFFPDGQNLSYIIETNSEIRKEFIDLLSEYNLRLLFEKGEKYSMKIIKTLSDGTIFSFPFHQIADTIQRLIFYKAAIQTNTNTVLLFEEPEAHMFPPYISKFTADIIFDKNNNQYFITTHNPFVLNDFMEELKPEELAIYAVGYSDGETTINRLSDKQISEVYQYGVDLFFNLEEFLKDGVK